MVNNVTNTGSTSNADIKPITDNKEKPKKDNTSTEKTEDVAKAPEKDNTQISKDAQAKPASAPIVSLGLDSSKPSAPDKTIDKPNRFGEAPREIFIPFAQLTGNSAGLVNPLPFSGLKANPSGAGVSLIGPKLNPQMNFASIDAPSQAVATLFDDLSKRYPNLEKSTLYRLSKVATYVSIDVPLMVASHEMGHAGAAVSVNPELSPNVVVLNWMSGVTHYNTPEGIKFDDKERLFMSVAGMNQATYNGEQVDKKMHTQGADIADAVQYLVNITNNANYQIKDWVKGNAAGLNDGSTYHKIMEERNKGWNQQNLSLLGAGVNLLNADFWASLIGGINYVATGEQIKLPEIKAGGVNVSFPNFSLINTYQGPQLNTSIFANTGGKSTLEVKYSSILTPDNGPAMGLEAKLYNIDVPYTNGSLSISPTVGVSVADKEPGYKVGGSIDFRPGNNKFFSLTADLDYRKNYMPDAYLPTTGQNGFSGILGGKASF